MAACMQVLVVGPSDLSPTSSGGTSRCEQTVQRAAELTQSQLMFVPTLFWVDESSLQIKTPNEAVGSNCVCLPDVHSKTMFFRWHMFFRWQGPELKQFLCACGLSVHACIHFPARQEVADF